MTEHHRPHAPCSWCHLSPPQVCDACRRALAIYSLSGVTRTPCDPRQPRCVLCDIAEATWCGNCACERVLVTRSELQAVGVQLHRLDDAPRRLTASQPVGGLPDCEDCGAGEGDAHSESCSVWASQWQLAAAIDPSDLLGQDLDGSGTGGQGE